MITSAFKDVFLSHRYVNKQFVRKLAADIQRETYLDKNLTVWLDEAEINPGQSVTGMINQGLETSRFIALILTPEYFSSDSGWTDAEWHAALYRDPDNRRGCIIPLLAEDCPYIPILLHHLGLIDIRDRKYEQGLRELISILRNQPAFKPAMFRGQLISLSQRIDRRTLIAERSPIDAYPDIIKERLYCNLLPVERLPSNVYLSPIADKVRRINSSGDLVIPSKQQFLNIIREDQVNKQLDHPFTPAFRVIEDNIISFHDLQDPEGPLSSIVEVDEVAEVPVSDFISDNDNRNLVVSLLNMSVRRHITRVGLTIDDTRKKGDRFFFPPANNGQNIIKWRPVRKSATRTVAKPCYKDGALSFWIHRAAYIRTLYLADRFYVQIEPTWVITEDGIKVKGGANIGRLLIKWTGPERNLHLLFHIRFWTSVLRQKQYSGLGISIRVGDDSIRLSSIPAIVDESMGIAADQGNLMAELDEEATLIATQEEQQIDEKLALDANEILNETDTSETEDDSEESHGDE